MGLIDQLRDTLSFSGRSYTEDFVRRCLERDGGLFDLSEAGKTIRQDEAYERLPSTLSADTAHELFNRILDMDSRSVRTRCFRELGPFLKHPHTPDFPDPDRLVEPGHPYVQKLLTQSQSTLPLHNFLSRGGEFDDPEAAINQVIEALSRPGELRRAMDWLEVLAEHHPGPSAQQAITILEAFCEYFQATVNDRSRVLDERSDISDSSVTPRGVLRRLQHRGLPLYDGRYDTGERTDGSLTAYLARMIIDEQDSVAQRTRAYALWVEQGPMNEHPLFSFIKEALEQGGIPQTNEAVDQVYCAVQPEDPLDLTRSLLERGCQPSQTFMKRLKQQNRRYYEQLRDQLPRRARNSLRS